MKKIWITYIVIATALSVTSCGGKPEAPADNAAETANAGEHEDPNFTTLTESQIKGIGIEFGVIEEKQLTASLKANGVLQVPNQNKASINSVYSGVIRSLQVQPGNTVRKGQVIATVANPDFIRVQEEYLGIHPRIVLAEQEYNRQKELTAGNAGALKNLQAAEANWNELKARKASLEQQVKLMGLSPSNISNGNLASVLSIRSPISGVVSSVTVKIGSYIDVSTAVAEIVDNSQLHLDLYVYEKDLPKLKNNQTIHFTLTNNPGNEYHAVIYSLGSSFEGESKAVTVHASVQGNKTGLIDGMNITAVISLDKATVPAVPTEAIVTWQGKDYIFIQSNHAADSTKPHDASTEGKMTFERIPVAKGTTDVGYTEVTLLTDIPAGAKLVTKGAFFVLAKQTNKGEEE